MNFTDKECRTCMTIGKMHPSRIDFVVLASLLMRLRTSAKSQIMENQEFSISGHSNCAVRWVLSPR